ncbi:hypothetical protein RRG08_029889 [Elysia crispata]|uniref:Uncharacterized protein n=1 Tax=Elysia crispata TaxID=231223 RepID=A0AAE1CZR7_9GAST|nr:hypothetical protein RRG08_029889 [Elysia crispata]
MLTLSKPAPPRGSPLTTGNIIMTHSMGSVHFYTYFTLDIAQMILNIKDAPWSESSMIQPSELTKQPMSKATALRARLKYLSLSFNIKEPCGMM